MSPEFFRNRNNVVARHHQRSTRAFEVSLAFFQRRREFCPAFRSGVLTAKFALAVSPSSRGDDGGSARIDAGSIERYGCSKTASNQGNSVWFYPEMGGEECQRISRIGNLVETNHAASLAFAFSATSHVETKCNVAKALEHLARTHDVSCGLVASEPMED